MSETVASFYNQIKKYLDHKTLNRTPDIRITIDNEEKCAIRRDKLTKFWKAYCKTVGELEDEINQYPLQIVQLPKETIPFVIKLDLKFKGFGKRKAFLKDQSVAAIAQAIQSYLQNTFIFDKSSDNHESCIVTMTDIAHQTKNRQNYSSFSVQFHFPCVRVDTEELRNNYANSLAESLQEIWEGGIGVFSIRPLAEDWKEMMDFRIYKQGLPLYGSVSKEGDMPLKFFQTYDQLPVIEKDTDYEEYVLSSEGFDPMEHSKVEQGIIKTRIFREGLETEADPSNKPDWYWLPLILSVDYWRSISNEIAKAEVFREHIESEPRSYDLKELISQDPNVRVEKLKTLDNILTFISMCKVDRILNIRYVNDFGEAFYDLFQGERDGLSAWISVMLAAIESENNRQLYYNKRNVRRKCEAAYNTFRTGRIDIETVAWYARIDSPEDYEVWHDGWKRKTLVDATSCLDDDVAADFYRDYWLRYKCHHNGARAQWWHYQSHRHKMDHGALNIKRELGSTYLLKFARMRTQISKQLETDTSQEFGKMIMDRINNLITNLKKNSFKERVIKSLETYFKVDGFDNLLDENPEVMGVSNGVIAATDVSIHFRPGKPQDYITKSCRIMYKKDFCWEHPIVDAAMQWAKKTFADPETIDYFWKYIASIIRGRNTDKKLMIFSGKRGNNSKSMWVRALGCVFGDYFMKMPMNLFTQGRGKANEASPVEAAAAGCRVVISEEPEESVPLLSSIIKDRTGDDDGTTRKLYGEPRQTVPMAKTIVVCNTPPVCGAEEAMEERVVVCPFESRWQNNAPKSSEEQFRKRIFKIDPYFSKTIPSLAPGILWIAYNYYSKYIEEGISKKPDIVKEITQKYWDDNDRYLKFIQENVEESRGDQIESNDLYMKFSRWHYFSYKKLDVPDKYKALDEFKKKRDTILGKPVAGAWHNVRIKERNKE